MIDSDDGDMEPGVNAAVAVTLSEALPVGLLVVTDTVPLPVNVTCTCGNGVPLLLPLIVPPVTDQVMVVLLVQLPAMVYVYCVPITVQVGPVMLICADPLPAAKTVKKILRYSFTRGSRREAEEGCI